MKINAQGDGTATAHGPTRRVTLTRRSVTVDGLWQTLRSRRSRKEKAMVSNLRCSLMGLAVGILAGCAGSAKPDDLIASSEASVKTAQEIGAQGYPRAALSLQLAVDELQHARDFIKSGDEEKAKLQLLRAKVDGDLALALTQSARAVADAEAARERLRAITVPASEE
jgi:hypothetical protein